jgi:hypothetical protein
MACALALADAEAEQGTFGDPELFTIAVDYVKLSHRSVTVEFQ